jgi:phospholipid/cholesterol/gamma-HCH transport system substrate-binding protein
VRWLTRLTSGAVIVIVLGAIALLVRARMPSTKLDGSFKTYTKLRDGSRLATGSAVVIAGVQVGMIVKMTVEGSFARIDMQLRDDLDLPADSFATRRADRLFGDSYVEIIPSEGDNPRRLQSGEPITHVVEGRSSDSILRGIGTALPKIDNSLDVMHDAVLNGRKWVSGPFSDGVDRTDEWLREGHIEEPVESADRAVRRIDDLTVRGAEAISKAVPEVASTLDRIDRAVVTAGTRIHDARVGLVQALHDTREGLDRVDPTIAEASDLMSAIDDGRGDDWKGTLGRAINDPALGDQLEEVTTAGREAAASLSPFRSWLGMRVEIDVFSRASRLYATAELRARGDKFYLAEIERGALGGLPSDQLSDVAGSTAYLRRQEIDDHMRFTAQFGKQLGPLALRGGLKDSTFGFGADLLVGGRLKLSADVFGSFQRTPRVKVTGALAVFRTLYVLGGVDDAFNEPGYLPIVPDNQENPRIFDKVRYGRDYFAGAMLTFTDEDIAVLLRVYGALLIGMVL